MDPLTVPQPSLHRAQRILIAAVLLHVILFVLEARGTFVSLFTPLPDTPPDLWGPFIKGADWIGYYAWLRSPLVDGDFHFDNEFAPTLARALDGKHGLPVTATGHRANHWPVGPAIVWAPAVVLVHGTLHALGTYSPWPADGYSPPYQLAVGGTTLALALLTLVLAYEIGRRFAGPTAAAAGAALLTLGTPVVAYGAVEVSMAHGVAAAALALFVAVWLRTFGSTRPGRWLAQGALLGLVSLMRWQLATFAVLPALEAVWQASRATHWSARIGLVLRLAAAGLMSVVVFVPHFLAKQIVYGHPLGGLHRTSHNWLHPSLWAILGSTDRSLFYWTPLTLPALVGLLVLAWRTRRPAAAILAVGVVVQIYTVSALVGPDVCLGWSFGFRLLTETCVLLAPGAAVLLDSASPQVARRLVVVGGVLVGWNLLLLGAYRHCLVGMTGADPAMVIAIVLRYFRLRGLDGLGMLALAGWLTYVLASAFRPNRARVAAGVPVELPERTAA
jgi:hypothetical protein